MTIANPSRTGLQADQSNPVGPAPRPVSHHPDPARAAAEAALSSAELELALARLRGDNDALRAKCARLAATVDELLERLVRAAPPAPRRTRPVAGHAPACQFCGSRSVTYRPADRGWCCAHCGTLSSHPRAVRAPQDSPERACPYCHSTDLRRRQPLDRAAWYCHSCGQLLPDPAPAVSQES